MRHSSVKHKFVETIPERLEPGILYVSLTYATAAHACCCGCGTEVVTPLSPTDWKLIFDGETVSLYPSIGNWSYPCRSHYVIDRGRAFKAPSMTDAQISAGRERDRRQKARYFGGKAVEPGPVKDQSAPEATGFWSRLKTNLRALVGVKL